MIQKNQPRYLQVKNEIISRILLGDYPDGTFLPAEKVLIDEFSVGRNTIRKALLELGKKRIILKQQGRPSLVQCRNIDKKMSSSMLKVAWLDTARLGEGQSIHLEIFQNFATLAAQKKIQLDYISLPLLSADAVSRLDFSLYAGVVTNGLGPSSAAVELFKRVSNLICIDHLINIPAYSYVCTDNRRGGCMAAECLLDRGCEQIIFLGVAPGFYSYSPFSERLQGFQDALLKAGIYPDPEQIIISCEPEHFQDVGSLLEDKTDLLRKIDGIFVVTDMMAVNTVFSLQRMGFSVPEDISVIGFDGLSQPQFMHPKLTTVRQPVEKIAQRLVDLIVKSCVQPELMKGLIQVEPEIIPGETVK